jgi:hypothetical protein
MFSFYYAKIPHRQHNKDKDTEGEDLYSIGLTIGLGHRALREAHGFAGRINDTE